MDKPFGQIILPTECRCHSGCGWMSSCIERFKFASFKTFCLLFIIISASAFSHNINNVASQTQNQETLIKHLIPNFSDYLASLNKKHINSSPLRDVSVYPAKRPRQTSTISARFVYVPSHLHRFSEFPSSANRKREYVRIQSNTYYPSISRGTHSSGRSDSRHVQLAAATRVYQDEADQRIPRFSSDASSVETRSTPYTEVTDEVLLQTYRARSPCYTSKLHWVRDEENCSVFFVCARQRIAAVMTCPRTEVWSNRVTNCVPVRSRWDDCTASSQGNQRSNLVSTSWVDESQEVQRASTVESGSTESGDDYSSEDLDVVSSQETDDYEDTDPQYQRRFNRRHSRRNGQYYESGGRRLGSTNRNRYGGYVVQRLRNSSGRKAVGRSSAQAGSGRRSVHVPRKSSRLRNAWSQWRHPSRLKHRDIGVQHGYEHRYRELTRDLIGSSTLPKQPETSAPITRGTTRSFPLRRYRFNKFRHALHRKDDEMINSPSIKSVNDLNFGHDVELKQSNQMDEIYDYVTEPTPVVEPSTLGYEVEATNHNQPHYRWWVNVVTMAPPARTTTEELLPETFPTTTFTTEMTIPSTLPPFRNTTLPPYIPECGISITSMIVGGLPAQQGRWPWVVSLQLSWARRHVCGATLVHPQWVVTAAHCVAGPDFNAADEWRAVFWQRGSTQNVDHIIKHPDFVNGDNYPNDIALLRLERPADVSGFDIRHACLPERHRSNKDWEECWIMGWGEAKENVETELKELEVNIRKNSECSARWGWKRILNSHVCVGNGDRGACNGDSGGPLICRQDGYHFLAGVTSWGVSGCQTTGYPSVFTRVAYYTDWIQDVIDSSTE